MIERVYRATCYAVIFTCGIFAGFQIKGIYPSERAGGSWLAVLVLAAVVAIVAGAREHMVRQEVSYHKSLGRIMAYPPFSPVTPKVLERALRLAGATTENSDDYAIEIETGAGLGPSDAAISCRGQTVGQVKQSWVWIPWDGKPIQVLDHEEV